MYGQDFWERVNLQGLCFYLANGGETKTTEPGTLEERYRRKTQTLRAAAQRSCGDLDSERAVDEILVESGEVAAVSFEAGFLAGLRIGLAVGESSLPQT